MIIHLPDVLDLLDYALPDQPLYIHFDVDVIDPNDAPAVSYPAPGGPDAEQVVSVFRSLASTGQITAVSLSSWNPEMDEDGRTQDVCMKVFNSIFNDE
jgi:arginase